MSEWKPIATLPPNTVVEIGEFPAAEHVPNLTLAPSLDDMLLAYPKATHWREPTPETIAQAIRARKEGHE